MDVEANNINFKNSSEIGQGPLAHYCNVFDDLFFDKKLSDPTRTGLIINVFQKIHSNYLIDYDLYYKDRNGKDV